MTIDDLRDDKLIKTRDAASILCMCERSLRVMRAEGRGPKFLRVSRRAIRYRPSDLVAYLQKTTQELEADPASAIRFELDKK
jgi:hypothetical protein